MFEAGLGEIGHRLVARPWHTKTARRSRAADEIERRWKTQLQLNCAIGPRCGVRCQERSNITRST